MPDHPTIYDLCDDAILRSPAPSEPGETLRLLYRHSAYQPALRWLVLRWCRHPLISRAAVSGFQQMFRTAMASRHAQWRDRDWIAQTFAPLADLLNHVPPPAFRQRHPVSDAPLLPSDEELWSGIQLVLRDALRVWDRRPGDPYFPVAAQVVLTGDDFMDGENFLNVLQGLGSLEYQHMTVLMGLIRCFVTANPLAARLLRRTYRGVCEPLFHSVGWIWHDTAYYNALFFDQLLAFVEKGRPGPSQRRRVLEILGHLVRFNVVTSQETSVTPTQGIRHPAITCLPKDLHGAPLCHMTRADWALKARLGFSDYVPDVDTTFLTLSMADKWRRWAKREALSPAGALAEECRRLLDHPWPGIIGEYQVGNGFKPNPPPIQISKPLDYNGAVPIWFEKPFAKPDGRVVREALGNEVCPGHNMDILESLLVNHRRWQALRGERLAVVQGFLEFQYRAFTSGNALRDSAYGYYLPEMNMYYAGRVYEAYRALTGEERSALDPESKMEAIRKIALRYCREEILGMSFNAFDAAVAVAALAMLRDDAPGHTAMARGLRLMRDAAGEGSRGHPYRAYEWNKMRHPTRIIVGSEVATSLFVLHALVDARHYLYGSGRGRAEEHGQGRAADVARI
jgi:hypothetical protein